MIDCEHKWPMVVTNRGLIATFCTLHQMNVNDTICSKCPDCEGQTPVEHLTDMGYPKRSEDELGQIRKVCEGCPLFRVHDQRCDATTYEPLPVDTVAQHPNNHCPENKW